MTRKAAIQTREERVSFVDDTTTADTAAACVSRLFAVVFCVIRWSAWFSDRWSNQDAGERVLKDWLFQKQTSNMLSICLLGERHTCTSTHVDPHNEVRTREE